MAVYLFWSVYCVHVNRAGSCGWPVRDLTALLGQGVDSFDHTHQVNPSLNLTKVTDDQSVALMAKRCSCTKYAQPSSIGAVSRNRHGLYCCVLSHITKTLKRHYTIAEIHLGDYPCKCKICPSGISPELTLSHGPTYLPPIILWLLLWWSLPIFCRLVVARVRISIQWVCECGQMDLLCQWWLLLSQMFRSCLIKLLMAMWDLLK